MGRHRFKHRRPRRAFGGQMMLSGPIRRATRGSVSGIRHLSPRLISETFWQTAHPSETRTINGAETLEVTHKWGSGLSRPPDLVLLWWNGTRFGVWHHNLRVLAWDPGGKTAGRIAIWVMPG